MSARTILKHLHQQGRMTDYQFDVINRNLKARPQGEWIDKGLYFVCSECKSGYMKSITEKTLDSDKFNYCPNCGAKMTKEAENE